MQDRQGPGKWQSALLQFVQEADFRKSKHGTKVDGTKIDEQQAGANSLLYFGCVPYADGRTCRV
jgi:hypothetical protein